MTKIGIVLIAATLIAVTAGHAEKTAPLTRGEARAVIMRTALQKVASKMCTGTTFDDEAGDRLMLLASQTLGVDVTERVRTHGFERAFKEMEKAGKDDWCEMVKSAPGYNFLLTITE